ncbi:MAG: hypothetical protein HYU66_11090 [Armatimonadetes bacterium]|nr:hypothetical protein [Armatimonadota bacterium]
MNLEERLKRLERSNRHLRLAVAAVLCAGLGGLLMGQATDRSVVRARRFVVEDADGQQKGEFGLWLRDSVHLALGAADKPAIGASVLLGTTDAKYPMGMARFWVRESPGREAQLSPYDFTIIDHRPGGDERDAYLIPSGLWITGTRAGRHHALYLSERMALFAGDKDGPQTGVWSGGVFHVANGDVVGWPDTDAATALQLPGALGAQ